MRLDYDFNGRSGYAFAARTLDLSVTPSQLRDQLLGRAVRCCPIRFEIKFTDASGENVHWRQTTRYIFQAANGWTELHDQEAPDHLGLGAEPRPHLSRRGADRVRGHGGCRAGRAGMEIDQLEPARPAARAVGRRRVPLVTRVERGRRQLSPPMRRR
jgi:hypothetical protein